MLQLPLLAREIDYNPSGIMFTVCTTSATLYDTLGSDAAYLFGMAPWVSSANLTSKFTGWSAQEFSDRYEKYYGVAPIYQAASAFASAEILAASIEESGSLVTSDIIRVMESSYFETFYANLTFDDNHQAQFDLLALQIQPDTLVSSVIAPAESAVVGAVFPVPTWAQRDCYSNTNYCSGHGACDVYGECQCDYGYYSTNEPTTCDTYCKGKFDDGDCIVLHTYYVGALIDTTYDGWEEYVSHLKLMVELINNSSDPFIGSNLIGVRIELMINYTYCGEENIYDYIYDLNDWSIAHTGYNLDGLIGPMCSESR
jgi:hypothetical protein